MPDLADRESHEEQLAAAILLLFQQQEEAVLAGSSNWDSFSAKTKHVLTDRLATVYILAIQQFLDDHNLELDERSIEQQAKAWAEEYAATLAGDITATTKDLVEDARKHADDAADLLILLALIFSEDRAATIGITEVTRAVSAGESYATYKYSSTTGEPLIATWNTSRRNNVCPVCRPLDGLREEAWKEQFPDGPPAHPRCNCYLTYRN